MYFTKEIIPNLKCILFTALISIAVSACFGGGGGGGGGGAPAAPVNTPPIANDDSAITSEDAAVNINVIQNDTDGGGIDPTSVMIVTDVISGTTQVNANGTVDYTPNNGFSGSDTFTYNVLDNQGAVSNVATVTIQVTEIFLVDDFEDGNFNGWTIVDDAPGGTNPVWAINPGTLRQSARVGSALANVESYHRGTYVFLSGAPGPSLTDYRFHVDATWLNPGRQGEDLGIMFRYVDSNNYYRLSLNSYQGFTRLEKRVAGTFTPLATNTRGFIRNQTIRFTVEVNGSTILVFQDGDPLFAVTDNALATGTVALYTQGDSSFDNVLIEEVSPFPQIVLSTPIAHSVVTGSTLNATAIATNVPAGGQVEFLLDGGNSVVDATAPYSAQFAGVTQGDHTVTAILRDGSNAEVDRDTNVLIGVLGDKFIGIGDSIMRGDVDEYESDNLAADPRTVVFQGATTLISQQLNTSLAPQPNWIINEGIGGDDAGETLNLRLPSILARNAGANRALIQLGTNGVLANIPDGLGCSGAGCTGTYKGNMQTIINDLAGAGIATPIISLLPPVWGNDSDDIFANPLTADVNAVRVNNYNTVISTELSGRQIGHDLFTFFLEDTDADNIAEINRISLFGDHLHPNGLGQAVVASLWHNIINSGSPVPLPFILEELIPSTVAPYIKQNLLEVGDVFLVDRNFTLASFPPVLTDGRWVMTSVTGQPNNDPNNYLSFEVDRNVTVYVAYDDDANAATRPAWLGNLGFVDTGQNVDVNGNPGADSYDLFSRAYNAGDTVMLGGNSAPPAVGHAMYFVIVVEN